MKRTLSFGIDCSRNQLWLTTQFKLLGYTGAGVSQVAYGTANVGKCLGHRVDEPESASILNAFAHAGGNFLDTADVYQSGQSEEILGNRLQGRREDFILATKSSNREGPKVQTSCATVQLLAHGALDCA